MKSVEVLWTKGAKQALFNTFKENPWDIDGALNAAINEQFKARLAWPYSKIHHGDTTSGGIIMAVKLYD